MHGVFVRVKHKSLPVLSAAVEKCVALVVRGPVPRDVGLARDRFSPPSRYDGVGAVSNRAYGGFMFIVARGPVPRDASVV